MVATVTPPALPAFPWDSLAPFKARAAGHPDGIVDLSVGTPVDPTPELVKTALVAAADSPGYPLTIGTTDVRASVCEWFARRRGVPGLGVDAVLPTIGSKELVAWLPTLLGLGHGDLVGIPAVAYPTYDIGARLAGATSVVAQSLTSLGPLTAATTPKLLWLNSPGNPNGQVLGVEHLRKV
ncbi:MAG: succinyldiaminopimelate aminotransferase apoenzyme, partial [Humibacillus sp.]|nr:succinyldiaminopimelate aminotransferase apoenzyme [Humibacillus sp.]